MKKKILLLCLALFLTACNSVEIYSGLSENQANIMLSTLLRRGIEAEKVGTAKAGYSISVNGDQMVQALEILKENSLPRDEFQSLGSIFSGQGMIATESEEKSRLTYALSQELSATFSQIDGVLSARVHIVLAEVDAVNNRETPASAAVFLRHTPDSLVVNYTAKIKELVASSVADLSIDNVSVMLVPSRDTVTVPVLKKEEININSIYLMAGAFALFINALIVGLYAFFKSKKNNTDKA